MLYAKVLSDPKKYARKSYFIEKSQTGRRLAISDIHGCARAFASLLAKIKLTKGDQLFLLGDYIHKGPDSKGVMEQILKLISDGYKVYPLRGNHEQMILDHHYYAKPRDYDYILFGLKSRRPLLDGQRKILPRYQDFFVNLPYYYELDDYFLCHAGIDSMSPEPFKDYNAMLWQREFNIIPEVVDHKKIVYGHVPHQLSTIKGRISANSDKICIDAGAVYPRRPGMGNLVCLDLDTLALTVMPNFES